MIVSKHCMDVFLITIMGMRKVMMMAVITTGSTMIVIIIAIGNTLRNSI